MVLEDLQKHQHGSKTEDKFLETTSAEVCENKIESINQAIADLENINAHLFSIEVLMERIFDVKVPEEIERKFQELAGELAPDPLNVDRIRLNRLLHQTPDVQDKS